MEHPGGPRGLTRLETSGVPLAAMIQNSEILKKVAQDGGVLNQWLRFRVPLAPLAAAGWERINWKVRSAARCFYYDPVL